MQNLNLKIRILAGNPVNSWFSASSQISLTLVQWDVQLPKSIEITQHLQGIDRLRLDSKQSGKFKNMAKSEVSMYLLFSLDVLWFIILLVSFLISDQKMKNEKLWTTTFYVNHTSSSRQATLPALYHTGPPLQKKVF